MCHTGRKALRRLRGQEQHCHSNAESRSTIAPRTLGLTRVSRGSSADIPRAWAHVRFPPDKGLGALFARIDNCHAKVLFEATASGFFQVIGGNVILSRGAYALGYRLVELI